jgi:DNA-binding MarR family transcriptional regulator
MSRLARRARSTEEMSKPLPEVLEFMQLLWRVVHALEQRSKRMAAATGITGPQRLVVRLVGLYPGISATGLATLLHVHPSTVTGVLRRLEQQGLLAREPDQDDRRRAVLTLSASGRRVNRMRSGTAEASVGEALLQLSGRDRACARRVLDVIASRLERGTE